MRGTFIAALLGRHLEELVTGGNMVGGDAPRSTRLVGSRAQAAASEAQQRLERLMPFDEWCAKLKPTQAAKELYLFVRARLEMRAAEAAERARAAANQPPRKRSRKKDQPQH
jgi:hypothetical protein